MNLFELLILADPIIGAVCGAKQGAKTQHTILGLIIGLLIGIGVYFVCIFITGSLMKTTKVFEEGAKKFDLWSTTAQWIGILLFIASPFLIILLSQRAVEMVFR
jgi:hypothetical protein